MMGLLGTIAGLFRRGRVTAQTVKIVRDRSIRGSYDLAQTTNDNRRHWASADSYDADSANSKAVRDTMVKRSRMETGNNGYLKGINLTQANYVIGRGPTLRMQSRAPGFNAMVETAWKRWAKRIKLARKLRTAIKAKVSDGETFLLATINEGLQDRVKLDLVGIECEQVASTDLLWNQKNRVDGVRFDEFGNPTHYDILPYHPGGSWQPVTQQADIVPAKFVFHLFREDRAGQHRAIPELSSTMGTCAQSRRWREATLQAAENLADFSIFVKTGMDPDSGAAQLLPFDTLEIEKGMMTALPAGAEAFQPKPEQPPATYEGFHQTQLSEQARPLSMSYALAACDSSQSNFASAKLDQHPYFASIDVEQAEIEDLVLDPLFELWFAEAVRVYGWNVEKTPAPSHIWDWPARPQVDEVKTSSSRQIDLATGVKAPRRIANEDGRDFEEDLAAMAEDYGVTVDEMREKLFATNFRAGFAVLPQEEPEPPAKSDGGNRAGQLGQNRNGNRLAKRGT